MTRPIQRVAKKILQRLEHEIPPETMVGDLRVGQQQMVEIARNLNQDDLRVLIMDEPTSSLSAAEVKVTFQDYERAFWKPEFPSYIFPIVWKKSWRLAITLPFFVMENTLQMLM